MKPACGGRIVAPDTVAGAERNSAPVRFPTADDGGIAGATGSGQIDAAPLDPVVGTATAGIAAAEAKQAAKPASPATESA